MFVLTGPQTLLAERRRWLRMSQQSAARLKARRTHFDLPWNFIQRCRLAYAQLSVGASELF